MARIGQQLLIVLLFAASGNYCIIELLLARCGAMGNLQTKRADPSADQTSTDRLPDTSDLRQFGPKTLRT